MGTNFYVEKTSDSCCEHCTATERVHIGKSSMGWKFSFKADPEWGREHALVNWMELVYGGKIVDEYGAEWSMLSLLKKIMLKQNGMSHLVNHGPSITGPYFDPVKYGNFDCGGFDFCDQEFS